MMHANKGVLNKTLNTPLARRFIHGAKWSVLGSALSSALTLLMSILVARNLGIEEFGKFIVLQSTLAMVGIMAGFGIGSVATRYVAELKGRNKPRISHILGLSELFVLGFGFLVSTSLALSASYMATHILNSPSLTVPLGISACAVFFIGLDSYQRSVLIGFEAMRTLAIGATTSAALGLPIMLIASAKYHLFGASIAIVIISIIQALVSRYQVNGELKKSNLFRKLEGSLKELPVLWKFAIPSLLSSLLVAPSHWTVQAFLANTPNGYSELAILGIAMQWFNIIVYIPNMAGRVVLPILTNQVADKDRHGTRKILVYATSINAVVSIPIAIIICICSSYIMDMYGKSYTSHNVPLVISALTATLLAILLPISNLLAATSRMWIGVIINVVWGLFYIILSYFLIDKGATGIMISMLTAYAFNLILTIWYLKYFDEISSRSLHG